MPESVCGPLSLTQAPRLTGEGHHYLVPRRLLDPSPAPAQVPNQCPDEAMIIEPLKCPEGCSVAAAPDLPQRFVDQHHRCPLHGRPGQDVTRNRGQVGV